MEGINISPLNGAALLLHGQIPLQGSLIENSNRLKDQKTVIPDSLLYAISAVVYGILEYSSSTETLPWRRLQLYHMTIFVSLLPSPNPISVCCCFVCLFFKLCLS